MRKGFLIICQKYKASLLPHKTYLASTTTTAATKCHRNDLHCIFLTLFAKYKTDFLEIQDQK